jgi:hypothetical protein
LDIRFNEDIKIKKKISMSFSLSSFLLVICGKLGKKKNKKKMKWS